MLDLPQMDLVSFRVEHLNFQVICNLNILLRRSKQDEMNFANRKFSRGLGLVSNFNQSINWHYHMKDHVNIGHLTKYDAFRVNSDQVMVFEIYNVWMQETTQRI